MSKKHLNTTGFEEAAHAFKNHILRSSSCVSGIIEAVNDDYTCDINANDSIFYSVPMRVLKNTQASITEVPVIGSECIFTFRNGDTNQPQLLLIDQIDQLLINCKTNVQFNGGKLGGMVKVIDLVTRLNNLENDINTLKAALQGWTPASQDGGAALKAASLAWAGQHLQVTVRSDIENTVIQQ